MNNDHLISQDEIILVTGSNGFIGSKVVAILLERGYQSVRCFVRPSSNMAKLNEIINSCGAKHIEVIKGNLISREDCKRATADVSLIYHVAAGIEKTFPGCYMNSVISTRNLLDGILNAKCFKRFVNVSSFAVYSNMDKKRRGPLDETCQIENQFMQRYDAYCFGKAKQDEIVIEYGNTYGIPYSIVRPGVVYGPGARAAIHSRVGVEMFGLFLHLGGSNRLPLTYIDNCADAIVRAGLKSGVDGEIFNVVDDNTPTSRRFLNLYKKHVRPFKSVFVPFRFFFAFCYLWELYSSWSRGQLPLAFNRRKCAAEWKGNRYPNQKIKSFLDWNPLVSTAEGLKRHFDYFKKLENTHA